MPGYFEHKLGDESIDNFTVDSDNKIKCIMEWDFVVKVVEKEWALYSLLYQTCFPSRHHHQL